MSTALKTFPSGAPSCPDFGQGGEVLSRSHVAQDGHAVAAQPAPAPYGVLILPSLLTGHVSKEEILLPLTLAYVFSESMEFRLPLVDGALAVVESAFDEILRSMPLASKGVQYLRAREHAAEALNHLMRETSLVITTNAATAPPAPSSAAEVVFLSSQSPTSSLGDRQANDGNGNGNVPRIVARNLDSVHDPELRKKIADCISLFELQAAGHITQGHFSVSW